MYGKIATTAASTTAGGAATLAYTGFQSMSLVVAAGTLVAVGAALLRISRRPKDTLYDS